MSRQFRSALLLAQSASAGPSSRPLMALPLAASRQSPIASALSPIQTQRRHATFDFLPDWLRGKRSNVADAPPASTTTTASSATSTEGSTSTRSGNLFEEVVRDVQVRDKQRRFTEHRYKSAHHKISHRKLADLSRQIAGLPIDEAIVQMEFSEKRAGQSWIKSTLCLARDHALEKGLKRGKLIVAESWVSKGRKIARHDIKGRGRAGIKHHPSARIHLLLKEGKTQLEQEKRKFAKELGRVRSAGVVREDGVLRRKEVSGWTW